MRELANHILHIAYENDSPITNLQLQKIMYFTLGFMIRENLLRDIAEENFNQLPMEAWLYGPVVPEIYELYKAFKRSPIPEEGRVSNRLNNERLERAIRNLIDKNPFMLVEISHNHRFWRENREKIQNTNHRPVYQFNDLVEAFNG